MIRRTRRLSLPAALAMIAGCTQATEKSDRGEVLCAAEALFMSRQASLPQAESDRLRDRAARFRELVPAAERDRASTRIEALADMRTASPLASKSECDALLGTPVPKAGA